jgi:tetratricopeptide (TPR) repeat protein
MFGMSPRVLLRAVGWWLLLGLVSSGPAAAVGRADEPTPKPLTAEQRERLKERDRLFAEALKLDHAGKLTEVLATLEKKLAIEREVFGNVHAEVAESLSMLASLHEIREDFGPARKAREEVLAVWTKLHGETDWRVTDARLALENAKLLEKLEPAARRRRIEAQQLGNAQVAQLYQQGKFADAVPLVRTALAVRKEVLGERHPDYAGSLNYLAVLYHHMGEYEKARPLYEQAVKLIKEVLGERHPHYANSLSGLALLYQDMGDNEKARPLLEQALKLCKEVLGERHPHYAASLNNLALLYWNMGDNEKARPLFEQALKLYKEVLGERHPEYAQSLNNLATLYKAMGDYEKARPLFEQALKLRKEVLGERHPHYAQSLNNLATLYNDMGDYEKARPLLEQALKLRKEVLGERHPHSATSLNDLGLLYKDMGDYEKARPLLEQALKLRKEVLGERHPHYASSLNNMALLYWNMGDNEKARPLLEQALKLRKEVLGERHPDYATSLNNLAALYWNMGDNEKARPLLEQALKLTKEVLGERHPDYALSLNNMGGLFLAQGDHAGAEALFHQALTIQQQHLAGTFTVLSDRQRLDFLNRTKFTLNWYLTKVAAGESPAERIYDHVLAWKGALAGRQAEDHLAHTNPDFRQHLEQLRQVRAGLAKLTATPPPPAGQHAWLKRFHELEEDKEQLELKLADISKDYFRLRQRRQATTDLVAKALPDHTALIDFTQYDHATPDPDKKGRWQVEQRLLAFVLLRDRPPVLVPLGPVQPIAEAVQAWRQPLTASPPGPLDQKAANELARRLWQPLVKHLGGATTVLLAPDGVLCDLPFAALPGSSPGSFLLEEVALGYVTSGRHLLETADERPASDGLLALGNLDYGPAPAARPQEGLSARLGPWDYLPGTLFEAEQVSRSWQRHFPSGPALRLLTGDAIDKTRLQTELAATKEKPPWRYLHLSTHGFFTPPEPEQKRTAGSVDLFTLQREHLTYRRNPLLLSGLVLAGANRSADDGLMTAEEVTALDLRGTELVVLSACDTGRGRVAGGQGVYGLQRAFQEAGAKSLAVSLWSVSDPATSVLMEEFYAQLWGKEPVSKLEALRRAQLKVLRNPQLIEARAKELRTEMEKRKLGEAVALRGPGRVSVLLPDGGKVEESRRSHPAYWAAFVLSGDWR